MRSIQIAGILILGVIVACSSLPADPIPVLENRTLKISDKVPGFEYQWLECEKKSLFGGCKKWIAKVELYDLTDPEVREKLRDMGFVAKVREKLGP